MPRGFTQNRAATRRCVANGGHAAQRCGVLERGGALRCSTPALITAGRSPPTAPAARPPATVGRLPVPARQASLSVSTRAGASQWWWVPALQTQAAAALRMLYSMPVPGWRRPAPCARLHEQLGERHAAPGRHQRQFQGWSAEPAPSLPGSSLSLPVVALPSHLRLAVALTPVAASGASAVHTHPQSWQCHRPQMWDC